MRKTLLILVTTIISILILVLTIRGNVGNPIAYQTELKSQLGSPFEASNSTSRYALTQAIVDRGTYFLTENQARFASPDLVSYKDNYISIFIPGASFIVIPFYMLGDLIGLPQLIAYTFTLVFAIL